MIRSLTLVAVASVIVAGCGAGTTASAAPSLSSGPTQPPPSPGATTSTFATQASVPAGRILFHRQASDEIERYFTINTDGTDERALYTAEGCDCAHWSADWTHVLTLGATGLGTWSFTTIRPRQRQGGDDPVDQDAQPRPRRLHGRWSDDRLQRLG